jgi:hypothetical protein
MADGTGRLTRAQIDAITTPRLPQTQIVDPATWVGSELRTDDDLRYSEFMHNWSGAIVILLGVAWLLQATGGTAGRRVGRLWPLALFPSRCSSRSRATPRSGRWAPSTRSSRSPTRSSSSTASARS